MFRCQLWVLLRLLGNTTCKVLGLKLHSFKHTARPYRSMEPDDLCNCIFRPTVNSQPQWEFRITAQTLAKVFATFSHLDLSSLVESFKDLVCHLSASADLYIRRNRRLEASQILEQLNDPCLIQKRWTMGNLPMHHFPVLQSRYEPSICIFMTHIYIYTYMHM